MFRCVGGDTFISTSENTNRQIYPMETLENEFITSAIEVLLTVSATLALCIYRFRMGRIALNKKEVLPNIIDCLYKRGFVRGAICSL